MTQPSSGYVPNEVIAIKLDALTDEVRELRRELVRRDVYDAQRQHDQARIEALERVVSSQQTVAEKRDDTERMLRRQVGIAVLTAVLAVLVQPLMALVN